MLHTVYSLSQISEHWRDATPVPWACVYPSYRLCYWFTLLRLRHSTLRQIFAFSTQSSGSIRALKQWHAYSLPPFRSQQQTGVSWAPVRGPYWSYIQLTTTSILYLLRPVPGFTIGKLKPNCSLGEQKSHGQANQPHGDPTAKRHIFKPEALYMCVYKSQTNSVPTCVAPRHKLDIISLRYDSTKVEMGDCEATRQCQWHTLWSSPWFDPGSTIHCLITHANCTILSLAYSSACIQLFVYRD